MFFEGSLPPLTPSPCIDLEDVKSNALSAVFPHSSKVQLCVMMLLSNLAEPEWVQVNCNKKLLLHVVCMKQTSTMADHIYQIKVLDTNLCASGFVLKENKCYLLVWYKAQMMNHRTLQQMCKSFHSKSLRLKSLLKFQFLFDAISPTFSPFLSYLSQSLLKVLSYKKYLNTYKYKTKSVGIAVAQGFYVCERSKETIFFGIIIYSCSKGGYISSQYLCDGTIDCPNDNSDEILSICLDKSYSKGGCSSLYFADLDGVCLKYASLTLNQMTASQQDFLCKSGIKIDWAMVNDLVADCGTRVEDEPQLLLLLQNKLRMRCALPDQIPCKEHHPRCYNITEICKYKLNNYNHLIPCRNGGHLENCKQFECNVDFKCYRSFCIPWSYVCNGKWDCSVGDDEEYNLCNDYFTCSNMFKCKNTVHTCVHVGNVCDGNMDCPFNDDEYLCELKDVGCPLTCVCLLLVLKCRKFAIQLVQTTYPHVSVFVYSIPILSLDTFVSHFPKVLKLSLTRTDILNICKTNLPGGIVFIDLGFNFIFHLSYRCFNSLKHLRIIKLENNCITYINAKSFYHLTNLNFLSLANNPLANLPKHFIMYSPCFKAVIFQHNIFTDINPNAFQNIKVEFIDTTDYHICCIAPPNAKCNAFPKWHISCTDLLPH